MPKQFLDPQGLSQFTENLEQSIIAYEYDSTATYALGDYCVYENLLYRCTTAITTAEAWTSGHWTQILVMGDLKLKTQIQTVTTQQYEALSADEKANGTYVITDTTSVPLTAGAIPYDNTSSGLNATDVQDAIDEIAAGGGGGGTSNYNDLSNKPQVNGITLSGDKDSEDLGIVWQGTQAQYDALTTIDPNTVYYITDSTGTSLATVATTGSYGDLTNKPQVNSVTLSGDKSSSDLGIVWQGTQAQYDLIATKDPNTMYFITDAPTVACDADEIAYDNTTSGLSATDAQSAIDELSSEKMDKANPTGTGSFSLNRRPNMAVGNYSVAEGRDCTASERYSHAEGYNTTAAGESSHAEGTSSQATYASAHAEGFMTIASEDSAHAEGNTTTASGPYSHAEGLYTTASGSASHAEGNGTTASGSISHAEGAGTTAQRAYQHVFGEYNVLDTGGTGVTTKGDYVEIVGNGTANDARSNARTLDWSGNEVLTGSLTVGTGIIGTGSISMNRKSGTTVGSNSVAEGYDCTASSYQSHAEGNATTASGNSSHSEGRNSISSGLFAHAEGDGTTASGTSSHSEGASTTAQANYSHAEGYNNTASAESAHVEGGTNTASGKQSHAEGLGCTSSGDRSHTEGYNNTASNTTAHAENSTNIASGSASHVEGYGNEANHLCQHVFGQYSLADTSSADSDKRGNYIEIVGNGQNNASRSNARTLDWNGNEVLAGGLKINGNQNVMPGDCSGTAVKIAIWSNTTGSANIAITTNTGKQFVITINNSGVISGSVINP